jgi:hypothetical protein
MSTHSEDTATIRASPDPRKALRGVIADAILELKPAELGKNVEINVFAHIWAAALEDFMFNKVERSMEAHTDMDTFEARLEVAFEHVEIKFN